MSRIILVTLIALFLAPAAGSAEQDDHNFAVSGTAKSLGLGVDFEGIINDHFRIGTGVEIGLFGINVPVYASWYPFGAKRHGIYVDTGVNIVLSPDFSGSESGTQVSLAPELGGGYAFTGDKWQFKAGVEVTYFHVGGGFFEALVPQPSIRFGYMF